MNPFMIFGVVRRIRRWAFVLFVAAVVYAGPRFARDMANEVRSDSTTVTTLQP